jgi:deoxyribodipyrimidine photo-lyase
MHEDHGRPAVVWFRRDLRLHDHPALTAAAVGDRPVVPLFVLDPELLQGRFASPNRTWFLLGCLRALAEDVAERGAPLVVRVGDPGVVVPDVARLAGATDVVVSRDHGPYGRARDQRVAEALAATGVRFHAKRGVLVHEPEELATGGGSPFRVYSPFRRAWGALPRRSVLPAPERLAGTDVEPGHVPTLADLDPGLGLGDAPTADPSMLPVPGEAAARDRLGRWLERGIATYDRTRDRVDLADGTSRLSADLHLGTLSPLEVVERALAAGDGAGPQRFVDELVWREFYAHVLFHEPRARRAAFQPAFDAIAWSTDDAAIAAWREGRTGYPVVDAAMRQLLGTGWLPNRARMVIASFLTKDLLVDWRVGEAHFMRHLIDGDVASNNGGWQWTASTGTDPQPWFRIFNPVTQGRRSDPDGDYVRRWVPELASLPTELIHAPWEDPDGAARAGVMLGRDYPMPVIDHAEARSRALAAYDAARRTS